jgi:hypothetical protein
VFSYIIVVCISPVLQALMWELLLQPLLQSIEIGAIKIIFPSAIHEFEEFSDFDDESGPIAKLELRAVGDFSEQLVESAVVEDRH